MSQYAMPTINPATHTGTDLASFLNAAQPALHSYHRGSSRPAYAVAGMIWIDSSVTNVDSVMYYDGTHDILLFSFDVTSGAITDGGPFTPGAMFHQGAIDPTTTAPASPRNGDLYLVTTAGTAHASFTGLFGTAMTVGDVIFYDGTNWQALKLQSVIGNYLPLAGGTLTGSLSLSLTTVNQPFTTFLPANVGSRFTLKNSTNGGAQFQAAAADAVAALFHAYSGIPNTTNTTAGAYQFNVAKHNGSGGIASLAAGENAFSITNNSALNFLVKGNGQVFLGGGISTGGEAAPDVDAGGICINHGANDGIALSIKNSDVAHPFTGFSENDTYANIRKISNSSGGCWLMGLGSGANGILFDGLAVAPNSTFSSGVVRISAAKTDGATGRAALASNENIVSIQNNNSTVVLFKGNGDTITASRISTGGETAPDVDAGGICINTGAADGNVLTLKNSDVNHPFTSTFEADTYFVTRKQGALTGGLAAWGITTGAIANYFGGYCGAPASGGLLNGIFTFDGRKTDGATGTASLAANEVLLSLQNMGTVNAIVMADGSLVTRGFISTGGELSPDVDAGGICLNQGAADNNILTMKSSDVAHGMTAVAETDTYALFAKAAPANGGLLVRALTETNTAFLFAGHATTPNSLSGYGAAAFTVSKSDGGGSVQALAVTETAFSIHNNSTAQIFAVRGNGEIFTSSRISTGGETAPDVDGGGICINHGANDGLALSIKNSDVAHGLTTRAETDTYFTIRKYSNTAGGALARAYSSGSMSLYLSGESATALTNSTGFGQVHIDGRKGSGTTTIALSSSENILSVGTDSVVSLVVKGNGSVVSQGSVVATAAASTGVAQYNMQVIVPDTIGNRGGFGVFNATGGALAGIAVEAIATGVFPNSIGKLDFWIQNGAASARPLSLYAGGAAVFAGLISTGNEAAPDVDAGGICINTGAADGNALTLKNSDVAHPFTTQAEADTYFIVRKASATLGGASIFGFSEGAGSALQIVGSTPTPNTSASTEAVISFVGRKNTGSTFTTLADNENLLGVFNGANQSLLLKGDGDLLLLGGLLTGGGSAPLGLNANGTYIRGSAAGPLLALGGAGVSQPYTGMTAEAPVLFSVPTTSGGLNITASSSHASVAPFAVVSIGPGSASVANMFFNNLKHNGSGGSTSFASGEVLFEVMNNGTSVLKVDGAGNLTVPGTVTGSSATSSISNGTSSVSIPVADTNIILTTAGAERLRILSDGRLSSGAETAPDVDAGGLCLNHGANDGNVLTLKNSDVAHPFTTYAEADTYARLRKLSATLGGLLIESFAESGASGMQIESSVVTPNTAFGQIGAVSFSANKSSAGVKDVLAANENAFSFYTGSHVALMKGNGDFVTAGRVCGSIQVVAAVAAGSTTANDSTQTLILSHAATIATYTVTLPVGRHNGQEFRLSARSAVTTLTMNTQSSQTIYGAMTTVAANGFGAYIYDTASTSWYRLH